MKIGEPRFLTFFDLTLKLTFHPQNDPLGSKFSKNFATIEFPTPKSFSGEIFMKIGEPKFFTFCGPQYGKGLILLKCPQICQKMQILINISLYVDNEV